jgi:molybdopterin-guanine dinucleotide biosynthesis protein A
VTATNPFAALVLAGSRPGGDPVAEARGVASKAQVRIGGRALLIGVLDALAASPSVGSIGVVGLPDAALADREFADELGRHAPRLLAGQATPGASVAAALAAVPAGTPVLVTTGDHALLSPEIVEGFLSGALASGADVAYGLARHERVDALLPGMRRTVLRLRDGGYCGCNLFAFLSDRGRGATAFWSRIEAHRKEPLAIARLLGPLTLLRFVTGRLGLEQAFDRLSSLCGATVRPVLLPWGEAAVDVDRPEDLAVAEALMSRTGSQTAASGSQSSSRNRPEAGSNTRPA